MTQPMPLSFSRLSTFEQCPAQFDYLYVSKRVKSTMNEASEYGDTSIHYVKVNGQERPSKREEWDERHLLRPQLP